MNAMMTKKEYAIFTCARMILRDECPPDRKHYLCMKAEDDSAVDCSQCWDNYLWAIAGGTAALQVAWPKQKEVQVAL